MIGEIDTDINNLKRQTYPDEVPLLALRNMVVMPGVIAPITISRDVSRRLVKMADKKRLIIGCVCQKDADVDVPTLSDLYKYGTYAQIAKVIELPFGNTVAILIGIERMTISEITATQPYFMAKTQPAPELMPDKHDSEFNAGIDDLRAAAREYIRIDEDTPNEAGMSLDTMTDGIQLLNFICANVVKSVRERQQLLETDNIKERMLGALRVINREVELQTLKMNIRNKTHMDIAEEQKNYFLREQIKKMKAEMGEDREPQEKIELKEKMQGKKWSNEVMQTFTKELQKLDQLNPQSPDFQIQVAYLQTLVGLPWDEVSEDNLDLTRAEKVLNRNHYGMEKVKERVLEFLAVLQLQQEKYENSNKSGERPKTPIVCLYGPPGVGKTSLGKSIADALKRKYVRMSLGGLHDESEIRGHRRTYIGAMPGRIIKNIQKAGTSNPVFVLDEIDKVVQGTVHGDPASALLEVLDPEQNKAFHDNYIDIDYDLSRVLFIATANDISGIPRPLLDRMELIEVSGYTTEEKAEIAKRHLLKRELKNTGLDTEKELSVTKKAIVKIIEQYTRESGVRQLEKQINKAMRKLALEKVKMKQMPFLSIRPEEVETLLGKPPYYRDIYQGNDYAGVVTGLAWTSVGGEILFIETSLSKGKGSKLTITGNLGDVMKESAMLALEYVKAHADTLNIDYRIFDNWNIHIHVPEGATPKDGPSAGITIATSIASALTQRKVRKNVAMTGEITLRGKVLPVGGIKEKILAAKRAGITDIMLCKANRKDIEEIAEQYVKGVTFHYVENVQDVWNFALTNEIVDNPVCLEIKDEKE